MGDGDFISSLGLDLRAPRLHSYHSAFHGSEYERILGKSLKDIFSDLITDQSKISDIVLAVLTRQHSNTGNKILVLTCSCNRLNAGRTLCTIGMSWEESDQFAWSQNDACHQA